MKRSRCVRSKQFWGANWRHWERRTSRPFRRALPQFTHARPNPRVRRAQLGTGRQTVPAGPMTRGVSEIERPGPGIATMCVGDQRTAGCPAIADYLMDRCLHGNAGGGRLNSSAAASGRRRREHGAPRPPITWTCIMTSPHSGLRIENSRQAGRPSSMIEIARPASLAITSEHPRTC